MKKVANRIPSEYWKSKGTATDADDVVINGTADEFEGLLAGETGRGAVVVARRAVATASTVTSTAVVAASAADITRTRCAGISALDVVSNTGRFGRFRHDTNVRKLSVVCTAHRIKANKV